MTRKSNFFEGYSWLKLDYLGPALAMALKLFICATNEIKIKVKTFWRLIPTFVEVTGEVAKLFCPPPLILNKVTNGSWSRENL